jgi:pSer/pThr/pTyr-binding forkhead associated (FHA) protein
MPGSELTQNASGRLLAQLIPSDRSGTIERAIAIRQTAVRVGRGADNDVILTDSSVSERHAELRLGGGVWQVSDLASVNGTRVDGEPVMSSLPVAPGSRLRLGSVELVFSPHDQWEDSPQLAKVALAPTPYILGLPDEGKGRSVPFYVIAGAVLVAIVAWLLLRSA